jgi:hypothetical protein
MGLHGLLQGKLLYFNIMLLGGIGSSCPYAIALTARYVGLAQTVFLKSWVG